MGFPLDASYSLSRRALLRAGLAGALTLSPLEILAKNLFAGEKNVKTITLDDAPEHLWKWSREVYYWEKLESGYVRCLTCPNTCLLPPDARSRCRSHVNKGGTLYTLVYGNPCAVHIDPIEKKPLYHFLPETTAFSVAATGCSFHCLNCQNWEISQVKPEQVRFVEMFPAAVIRNAREAGCRSIAYTYAEATTFFEYMIDTCRAAREAGVRNVWVTNGYINEKPLRELCGCLDGANVDVKSFSESTYASLNAGRLAPVLRTLEILKDRGVWFEMTALIVPTYTDDPDMVKKMCHWILEHLGPDHPLHFSRFFPRYKLTHLAPTPVSFLEESRRTAMSMGLHYVYVGNVPPGESSNTYCPGCKTLLIERVGYTITKNRITKGTCPDCGEKIAGLWS
ncbi:MAG: AmmeMemoRadiSam system radical SAM enzyme [Deltaproteobacteria bacterium]|nr:AmmeMemoRadiSam system radical SAM enzyme [Deltaproteobacteria bacterium]